MYQKKYGAFQFISNNEKEESIIKINESVYNTYLLYKKHYFNCVNVNNILMSYIKNKINNGIMKKILGKEYDAITKMIKYKYEQELSIIKKRKQKEAVQKEKEEEQNEEEEQKEEEQKEEKQDEEQQKEEQQKEEQQKDVRLKKEKQSENEEKQKEEQQKDEQQKYEQQKEEKQNIIIQGKGIPNLDLNKKKEKEEKDNIINEVNKGIKLLENIKSKGIINILFSDLDEKRKLEMVKYNQKLKDDINIKLINYKLFSGRYIVYEMK